MFKKAAEELIAVVNLIKTDKFDNQIRETAKTVADAFLAGKSCY